MLCAVWATRRHGALSLVERLSSWPQLGMQRLPQQAVPGLNLVPASCCSFQAWCRRQAALAAQPWTDQAAADSRPGAEKAVLRTLQTMFRVQHQGCMLSLHHQGHAACGQLMWHLMCPSAASSAGRCTCWHLLAAQCVQVDMLQTSRVWMVLQMQGALVQLQQQAAALQSQQQRGFTASARDVAGLQAQLSAVAQRQQQQLYTDEATAAATAAAAVRTGSSSSPDSRSGAGAAGTRKDEPQRQVTHGPVLFTCYCMDHPLLWVPANFSEAKQAPRCRVRAHLTGTRWMPVATTLACQAVWCSSRLLSPQLRLLQIKLTKEELSEVEATSATCGRLR